EVEGRAVRKAGGVGAGREVEALDDDASESRGRGTVEAVDGHQAVERADAVDVRVGQVPLRGGIEVVSRDVVLVTVAVENPVGGRGAAGTSHQGEGRIDDHRLLA